MNRHIDQNEITRRIAELPREVAPVRDPWPEISARIARRPSNRIRAPWALGAAAAALLTVAAAWLFTGTTPPPAADAPGVAAAQPQALPAGTTLSMPVAVEASDAEYFAAFREFIPVGQARDVLPAGAVERIEAGWADLQQTEQALAAALAERPENTFLNSRMLELRARQLGFLRQLASLEQDYRRLTI